MLGQPTTPKTPTKGKVAAPAQSPRQSSGRKLAVSVHPDICVDLLFSYSTCLGSPPFAPHPAGRCLLPGDLVFLLSMNVWTD